MLKVAVIGGGWVYLSSNFDFQDRSAESLNYSAGALWNGPQALFHSLSFELAREAERGPVLSWTPSGAQAG